MSLLFSLRPTANQPANMQHRIAPISALLFAALLALPAIADLSDIRPKVNIPADNTVLMQWQELPTSGNPQALLREFKAARQGQDPQRSKLLLELAKPYLGQRSDNPTVLMLQSELRDYLHDFEGALRATETLIAQSHPRQPGFGQLHLQAINLSIALGYYSTVREHCGPIGSSLGQDWATVCHHIAASLLSDDQSSLEQQYQSLAAVTVADNAQQWQQRALAEFAWRLARADRVELHCQALLTQFELSPANYAETSAFCAEQLPVTTIKSAEWLKTARNSYAVAVQKLRLHADNPKVFSHEADALQRLLLKEKHLVELGQSQHHREIAQYLLLEDNAPAALEVAQENWRQQKFLSDAALLLQARAANEESGRSAELADLPYIATPQRHHVLEAGNND